MTADEAFTNGLVTRVFPDEQFEGKVKEIVDQIGSLPPKVCTFQSSIRYVHFNPVLVH